MYSFPGLNIKTDIYKWQLANLKVNVILVVLMKNIHTVPYLNHKIERRVKHFYN